MTTSNKVIVNQMDSALFVPLESLHSKDDSITFVYKKAGLKIVKQEVQVGETNSNEAIIKLGLDPNDKIYLSMPSGMEDDEISLLAALDGKRMQKDEPQESKPKTRTITLPNGTTREVTEEQMRRFQQRRGGGQGGGRRGQ